MIKKKPFLAKTYEKLEYIQSSGTQYIDTNYKTNNKSKIFLDVAITGMSGGTSYSGLFGSRTSNHSTDSFLACRNNGANNMRVEMGNAKYANFNYAQNTRYNLEFNYQYVKVNGTQYNTGQTSYPQSTKNIFLFGLNENGSLETAFGVFTQKMYGARIEEDVIKLNLIPVKRLKDNAIGMLDTLTNTFYENKGTGAFTGQSLSTPEYIEELVYQYDYIEANGTQYIDTGIKLTNNSKVKLKIEFTTTSYTGTAVKIFGSRNGAESNNISVVSNIATGQISQATLDFNNSAYAPYRTVRDITTNTIYNLVLSKEERSVNGEGNFVLCPNTIQTPANAYLFNVSGNAYGDKLFVGKCYGLSVEENGVSKLNLIPVKYNNEYCLLDLVSGNLYHNAGTGEFTGGDITHKTHIYESINEGGVRYDVLEYLENTAQSYINLNIACNLIKNVEVEFMGTSWTSDQVLYGAFSQSIKGCNYAQISSNTAIYGNGSAKTILTGKPTLNTKYKITSPITSTGTAYLYENGVQKGSVAIPTENRETLSMMLFTLNLNGSASATHYTKMKVYSFKGYGFDDKPLFDLIPVEKEDGTLGMFDLVNKTFNTNAGTGTFIGGDRIEKVQSKKVVKLGTERYRLLDYIRSTDKQAINTNYRFQYGDQIKVKMRIHERAIDGRFFGALVSGNGIFVGDTNSKFNFRTSNTQVQTSFTYDNTSVYDLDISLISGGSTCKISKDGTELQTLTSAGTMNMPTRDVHLFCSYTVDGLSNYSKIDLFEFMVIRNNETLVNLIPVERITDNEIGMLDLANGTFLTNVGSGTFSKGDYIEKVYGSENTPFYIEAVDNNTVIGFSKDGLSSYVEPSLEYSYDCMNWETYSRQATHIELNAGERVYFRGDNATFNSSYGHLFLENYGRMKAGGNIMSLIDKTMTTKEIPNEYCFYKLFYYCSKLLTPPELPATTLKAYCYSSMFMLCEGLIEAPELPATTLANYCYYHMFNSCISLPNPPELPATTLANYCYSSMFDGCSSLKVSSTKTGSYTKEWRIPSGNGIITTEPTNWNDSMLSTTGGTFTGNPTKNTTYYVAV